MDENNRNKVLQIIEKAFEGKRQITEEDSMETVEEWDSFGHILILTALDKEFNGKVAGIQDLAGANSVNKILGILEREKLI